MTLTYSSYVTDLANLLVVPPTDANYLTVLSNIIDDTEQRIYRELAQIDCALGNIPEFVVEVYYEARHLVPAQLEDY